MELWFEMAEVHWFIWAKSCGMGARRLDKSDVMVSNWLSHLRTPRRALSSRKPADALKWTATEEQEKFAGLETNRWWKRDGETETARAFRCARFLTLNFSPWHSERGREKNLPLVVAVWKTSPFFIFLTLNSRMWEKTCDCQSRYLQGVFIYPRHLFLSVNPAPSHKTHKEKKTELPNYRISVI